MVCLKGGYLMKYWLNTVALFLILSLQVHDTYSARTSVTQGSSELTTVSWYGKDFHGKPMKNGEIFDMNDPSIVAHKYLPMNTKVRIVNLENGVTLYAVVKDRIKKKGRVDVSLAGAKALGFKNQGLTKASIEVLL